MKERVFIVALFFSRCAFSQQAERVTLDEVYELAQKNYPAIKQKDLVRKTAEISIANLQKGFLPQVSLNGQATYQSEVTRVPVSLPGLSIEPPAKDQYRLVADLNQLIYDGGVTREQKALQEISANVEDQKIEVELYRLKERINQLYLGVLYINEQLRQVELVKADISTGIRRVEAQVRNGVAFKSNLSMLKAELLRAGQRTIELGTAKRGILDALELFLARKLDDGVILQKPSVSPPAPEIIRPELRLFEAQEKLASRQNRLITAKNSPKASLFAQGGYGRPGLNLLKNEFEFYYVGGLRFNWSLGGLYTKKKEREQVEISRRMIDVQKETFLFNTNTQLKQQLAEIRKMEQLVASDNEIIELRRTVTEAARAQLENGVITANDYLREVNAEDQARQSLISHEIQLLQAQINYQTISGKQ